MSEVCLLDVVVVDDHRLQSRDSDSMRRQFSVRVGNSGEENGAHVSSLPPISPRSQTSFSNHNGNHHHPASLPPLSVDPVTAPPVDSPSNHSRAGSVLDQSTAQHISSQPRLATFQTSV